MPDAYEQEIGTDVNNQDTDGDDIPDGVETLNGLNPGSADSDDLIDSDGDGLSDTFEASAGTNPRDPDTDHDGLTDADELIYGFNPVDPDTDKNGLLDGYEPALRQFRYVNQRIHF